MPRQLGRPSEWADLRSQLLGLFVAVAAAVAFLPRLVTHEGGAQDLYIYRAGAGLALAGRSPYDRAALYEVIAAKFPEQPLLIANHGFFLAPAGVALFTPLALCPWPVAMTIWYLVNYTLIGLATWQLVPLAGATARRQFSGEWRAAIMVILLWDPLVYIGTAVGQTAAVMTGCVIVGETLRRRGHHNLSALLWAVPFAKPHLALPLLPLAIYLGGWRQGLRVGVAATLLTLAGMAICANPLLPLDFLNHLSASHKAVDFNKVTWNPQLLSWNRPFLALTGHAIELGATEVLLGYALVFTLVSLRVRLASSWPTPAWALAMSVTAAMVCCQLLASEALFLIAVIPHLLDTCAAKRWRTVAWLGIGLILKSVPFELVELIAAWEFWTPTQRILILSPRGFGVVILATGLIVTGWRADPPPTHPAA